MTDYSNASRTCLFNINTLEWDEELLELFEVDKSMLPEVKSSSEIYGYATRLEELGDALMPIAGIAGDQQASLFGQGCFKVGDLKNTYGTGCFMLMNTGNKPVLSNNGLLTTLAWGINGEVTYALEGSVFVAGSSVQWLRDGLRFFEDARFSEIYATRIASCDGVYVVPSFVGLGAPYWDDDARGAIFGITRATSKEHIIRATLESIAFQSKDVMEVMKEESNSQITHLAVDGGACANNFLMQFQSDISGIMVQRSSNPEATALGAAYLAGLATGFYRSREELVDLNKSGSFFKPSMPDDIRADQKYKWHKAIRACCAFARE